MTGTNPFERDRNAMSMAEIMEAARRERAAYVGGLLSRAFSALGALFSRPPSPAAELRSMDDRGLADIGITRCDVEHVLRDGRDVDQERRAA